MDTTLITNYFELYGGLAIFVIVLLEYLNLPGFPAGIIMPLAGVYAAKEDLASCQQLLFLLPPENLEAGYYIFRRIWWKCLLKGI